MSREAGRGETSAVRTGSGVLASSAGYRGSDSLRGEPDLRLSRLPEAAEDLRLSREPARPAFRPLLLFRSCFASSSSVV